MAPSKTNAAAKSARRRARVRAAAHDDVGVDRETVYRRDGRRRLGATAAGGEVMSAAPKLTADVAQAVGYCPSLNSN